MEGTHPQVDILLGKHSDPSYLFIVLLFSGRGSVELVVVPIVLSTFKLFCLSFRMGWAWLLQVGRALAPMVVAQFLNGPLERGLHTSSISCLCKTSVDVVSTLQRISVCSSGRARAGSTFWCKFWEGEIYARADWSSRSSGCTLFLCLGARAGLLALERT